VNTRKPLVRRGLCLLTAATAALVNLPAHADSQQQYEPLAASVRATMHRSVNDVAPAGIPIKDAIERERWMNEMSLRLSKRISDPQARTELLTAVHYEATRAGLDPQLVLSLIQIESNFKKYALSKAGAHGYMQVMPFWTKLIGSEGDNLFHLRTNLRYGCTILRHYLDIEKGNIFRALGRYNGSLGRATYPNRVRNVWQNDWPWDSVQSLAQSRQPSVTQAEVLAQLQALQAAVDAAPQEELAEAQAEAQAEAPVAPAPASPPPPAAPQVVARLDVAQTDADQALLPVSAAAPVVAQAAPQPQLPPPVTRRNIVIVR
jgi:hypothetical protein